MKEMKELKEIKPPLITIIESESSRHLSGTSPVCLSRLESNPSPSTTAMDNNNNKEDVRKMTVYDT